jgi:hypothetical protein
MTPIERTAYNAGIKATINAAQIAAITIETADDANTFRKQVAAEGLAAFEEGARGLMLEAISPDSHCSHADINNALPVAANA